MKRIICIVTASVSMLMTLNLSAQNKTEQADGLTYCLPQTVVRLEVEAVQENFFAGPYAKYAEKYLGIEARQNDESSFRISNVKLTPFVEADYSKTYTLNVKKGNIDASFLKLSSQGLVSFADAVLGKETAWRFLGESDANFSDNSVTSNLVSEAAVLYKNDSKEDKYNKVSVQQNVIVAKSLEVKASETAEMIQNIRRQRLQIVTGDTDATYSGEAMKAAIDELTRLENEYMMLFTGYSEYQKQKMNFDVLPNPERETQIYVAFRLSDTLGLLPADNLSGKPIVMEFVTQDFGQTEVAEGEEEEKKNAKSILSYYRVPAISIVKLMDGVDILLQTRMPVYQLGQEMSMPVNVILK